MKGMEISITLFRKVALNESVEDRHKFIMKKISQLEAPLGLKSSEIPDAPEFGNKLIAVFYAKNSKTKGIKMTGTYVWRKEGLDDWDKLIYEFKSNYKLLDYSNIINVSLPKVIEIYTPYDTSINFNYIGAYEEGTTPETRTYEESINPAYLQLKRMGITPGELGKNLFVLQPVMYFSGEMCREVLKMERDEVIKRLEGRAQKVFPLLNGVYIILSDKVEMSYSEFKEMNDIFKPILDLI